jgi:hypothetical protein
MAAALIDRLLHHCYIINIRGNSFRMRHHSELWTQRQGDTPTAAPPWPSAEHPVHAEHPVQRRLRRSRLVPGQWDISTGESGTFVSALTAQAGAQLHPRVPRSGTDAGSTFHGAIKQERPINRSGALEWSRRESNPRPRIDPSKRLRACSAVRCFSSDQSAGGQPLTDQLCSVSSAFGRAASADQPDSSDASSSASRPGGEGNG